MLPFTGLCHGYPRLWTIDKLVDVRGVDFGGGQHYLGAMSTSSADRRRHPRQPVPLPATLVDDDGFTRYEVTVRNVSAAGAMLEFAERAHVSREFYLLLPGHNIQPCRLCWQSGTLAGVAYVEA